MSEFDWYDSLPVPVTFCDSDGIIVAMNDAAAKSFADRGGRALIGSNLLDCHNVDSQAKIRRMLAEHSQSVYTSEKNGRKLLVYQAPWYRDGEFAGLVEISFDVPMNIPNNVRG
jgi:transcriptional regulator with PAS, ATPase and Fis domain